MTKKEKMNMTFSIIDISSHPVLFNSQYIFTLNLWTNGNTAYIIKYPKDNPEEKQNKKNNNNAGDYFSG